MAAEQNTRHICFERVVNFRDLGGYRTGDGRQLRWRRLFRSAALHHMSPADVEKAMQLGIKNVIDLRWPDEVRVGLGPFVVPPVNYHSLPLLPENGSNLLDERLGKGISAERYISYLSFGAEPFVAVIELLAKPDTYPALIHCSAGKDRTGVISAMVLDILGVDFDTIVQDYNLSNLALKALAAPPEAIKGFLLRLREQFGSCRGYFEARGVKPATFEGIALQLVE